MMCIVLFFSLFFPWIHFEYLSVPPASSGAFSYYTGYIGYCVLASLVMIPFFLLSHSKKERIRAHVPFRLSDTQAVVFIASMLITSLLHTVFMSEVFAHFAQNVQIGGGFLIATSSVFCIIVSAFFLSKTTKEQAREVRYLDHHDRESALDYQSIIRGGTPSDKGEDSNMTLPI